MAEITLQDVVSNHKPVKLTSGSFYLSYENDRYTLKFVEDGTNREEMLTEFPRKDFERLATSSGNFPDQSDVTIHMHSESKCDISEPGTSSCCDTEHECHVCIPVERYLCFDWAH